MATEFYVEQADRSPKSGVANETIKAGELVHDDGDGVNVLTFAAADEDDAHVGLARYDAEAMAAEWDEEIVDELYDSGQRVQYQPFEGASRLRIRTPEDNGTDPAPTIGHATVVGFLDASAVQGTAAEFQGRIVEEGYSDGTTTFDRSTGNFIAIGVAYRPDSMHAPIGSDDYDEPIRVELFSELKESA